MAAAVAVPLMSYNNKIIKKIQKLSFRLGRFNKENKVKVL